MDPRSSVSFARLSAYFRRYALRGLGVLMLMIITITLGLVHPLVIRTLIDDVLLGGQANLLLLVIGLLGGVVIIRALMGILSHYLFMRLGQSVLIDLRKELYTHLHRLRLADVQRSPSGAIVSRIINDVGALQTILTSFVLQAISNSLMLVVSVGVLLVMDWQLALISFFTLPCLVAVARGFGRPVKESNYWVQRRVADMNSFLHESLAAFFLLWSMAKEWFQLKRFDQLLDTHKKTVLTAGLWSVTSGQSVAAVGALGPIVLLWFGSNRVLDGHLTTGTLIAFFTYLTQMYGPLQSLTNLNVKLQGAMASVERIFGFLDLQVDPAQVSSGHKLTHINGEVTFDQVSFAHGQRIVLDDISVQFPPGSLTAVVGASGAGKSTLVQLLIRMHAPDKGRILVDGNDIADIDPQTLREKIVLIPQDVFLFNDTIANNVRFGNPDASDEDVYAACASAGLDDIITKLSDGYDTVVGDRGATLSGGERQRIALARAVLASPRVLVLDEATASLDTTAERSIMDAVKQMTGGITTIVITHRPSSIMKAPRTAVIKDGCIADVGRHDELVKRCQVYAELTGQE